ncbi:MAG: hypothetical protein KDK99_04600 [Verrucomicrobiales bacterium]|nr:hypothetical protein [Verrucomicrobiales bacterium]
MKTLAAIGLSGLLFAASFPPMDVPVLMPVALLLLVWVVVRLPPTLATVAGFWQGLVGYGIAASWFWEIFHVASLGLVGILAVFHGLFGWVVARWFGPGRPLEVRILGVACAWTTLEFLRGELFWLNFPWYLAGSVAPRSWLLPWIGVYGMGWVMAAGAGWLVTGRRGWPGLALMAAVFVPMGVGSSGDEGAPVQVALVQDETAPLSQYLAQSEKAPQETQLYVWPEYAYLSDLESNPADMKRLRAFLKERPEARLVLGAQTWGEGEDWRNTAVTLNAEGVVNRHFKNHTVHLFNDGVRGTEAKPTASPFGLFGTPVCFDCDFQDVVRSMVAAGAEFLVAPTMDAATWTRRQHEQHARLFQIRAAENGRWIGVAASSGVTQIIDAKGRVRERLPVMESGLLTGVLHRRVDLTFYTRWGWMLPWLVLVALIMLAVRSGLARRVDGGVK